MGWLRFWWQCFARSVSPAIGDAERILFLAGIVVAGAAALFAHQVESSVPWWAIALLTLAGTWLIRALLIAPYQLYREERRKADADAVLPKPFVRSLADSQSSTDQLTERLNNLALVFEQYKRLLESTFTFGAYRGDSLQETNLGLVAKFAAEEGGKLLPPVQFRPHEPLIMQTGWNQYRYIFDAPMRVPPRVSFPDLPTGVSAHVIRVSKIDFEVTFWHGDSTNRERAGPYACTADAEL